VKSKNKLKNRPFEITEKALLLHGWHRSDLQDPLFVIQQEIGGLKKHLADAKQALSEDGRLHREEVECILHSVLEVLDAFDRVFSSVDKKNDLVTEQMKIWIGNFRTVFRLTHRILETQGVARIENIDAVFDPCWHKVLETVPDPSKADGTIVEVVHNGYVWKGRLLRKAEVIVVRNNNETEAARKKQIEGTGLSEES
jgi:molecular chaperone GrpE (heat shock protein)